MIIANNISTSSELSKWTREFAQITLPVCANPSLEMIRQAIATHLPPKLAEVSSVGSAEELLDEVLGIATIVEYGREKIGWTATTDPIEAEEMRQLYSSDSYSETRHSLGIDGLWIFLVDSELLNTYFEEDLVERAPDPLEVYETFPEVFRIEDRQECVVVKL